MQIQRRARAKLLATDAAGRLDDLDVAERTVRRKIEREVAPRDVFVTDRKRICMRIAGRLAGGKIGTGPIAVGRPSGPRARVRRHLGECRD